jgi:hypothetical protein
LPKLSNFSFLRKCMFPRTARAGPYAYSNAGAKHHCSYHLTGEIMQECLQSWLTTV